MSLPPSYTPGPGDPPTASEPPPLAAPVPKYGLAKGSPVVVTVVPARTPSPTPSEAYVLTHKSRACDLRRALDFRGDPRRILSVALTAAGVALLVLFLVYQSRIEKWLHPFAEWMHNTPGGWLIPIAIMFVLSFPPLFGHEIVAVLCGAVWGIGVGFGIVAAGTVLGELGGFVAFKYMCRARAAKMEENQLKYALLAQVVRDGGFRIPVVMRFSAIPGHILTAVFASLGMALQTFVGAAVLGLPKQLVVVYIGVSSSDPKSAKTARIVKGVVIALTALVTHLAMRYVYRRMDAVKERVVYRRRKARQAKVLAAVDGADARPKALDPDANSDVERVAANATHSDAIYLSTVTALTLTSTGVPAYRRPPGVVVDPHPNPNVDTNPFGSSRDTVDSAPAVEQ